jgi:hypothetical protein
MSANDVAIAFGSVFAKVVTAFGAQAGAFLSHRPL